MNDADMIQLCNSTDLAQLLGVSIKSQPLEKDALFGDGLMQCTVGSAENGWVRLHQPDARESAAAAIRFVGEQARKRLAEESVTDLEEASMVWVNIPDSLLNPDCDKGSFHLLMVARKPSEPTADTQS